MATQQRPSVRRFFCDAQRLFSEARSKTRTFREVFERSRVEEPLGFLQDIAQPHATAIFVASQKLVQVERRIYADAVNQGERV